MDIPTFTLTTPAQTKFIRVPIIGPKPWNKLVFIQCDGLGLRERTDEFFRYRLRFNSQFKIDDFKQAQFKWYQDNTYISATAFFFSGSLKTDMTFIAAVENIKGFVDPEGRIGFETQIAMLAEGGLKFGYSISAYVLLYEPEDEPPPPAPPTKPGWMPKIEELPSQFRRRRDFRITDGVSVLDK